MMLRKLCLVFALVALMCVTQAIPGRATIYPLNNGNWTEMYYGGGPGQINDVLNASDAISTTWALSGFKIDAAPTKTEDPTLTAYVTTYNAGTLTASGYGGPDLNSLDTILTVTAYFFTATGAYDYGSVTGSGTSGGYTFAFTGSLSETGSLAGPPVGHHGTISYANVNVSGVPIPPSALLLGSGLLGLVGIRRFRKS